MHELNSASITALFGKPAIYLYSYVNNDIMVLIMEPEYGTMPTLHGQNLCNIFTGGSDTVTDRIYVGVTATTHYFPQKWRVIFSLFEILGLSTDRHNRM